MKRLLCKVEVQIIFPQLKPLISGTFILKLKKKVIASTEAQYKLEKELHIFLKTFQIYILKTKYTLKQTSSKRPCFKQPVITALPKQTEEQSTFIT